jgi:hypothetical protein
VGYPAILLPLFVQVGLTFLLLFWMGGQRLRAVRAGAVDREAAVLGLPVWPPYAQQAANAFSNQFQLPVLFYVLVIIAMITRQADLLFVVLSWVFVATRILHAAIHITSNDIRLRFPIFAVGAVVLLIMWAGVALSIMFRAL